MIPVIMLTGGSVEDVQDRQCAERWGWVMCESDEANKQDAVSLTVLLQE